MRGPLGGDEAGEEEERILFERSPQREREVDLVRVASADVLVETDQRSAVGVRAELGLPPSGIGRNGRVP